MLSALAATLAPAEPTFVPIVPIVPAGQGVMSDPATPGARSGPRIEVRLAGAELRVAPGTDAVLLTMVLRAIRASAP